MEVFKLPDLGEGLPDAEVVRWHVNIGDVVEADQTLVEMETAKAVVEIPAPQSGRIVELHGQPGDVIETGAPLVTFGHAGEFPRAQPEAGGNESPEAAPAPPPSGEPDVKASPPVRALARKLKVDLAGIKGGGRQGAITLADVRNAAKARRHEQHRAPAATGETGGGNTVSIDFGKGVRAAPRVRAYAAEAGVDIRELRPTGHLDNVTLKDVKNRWTDAARRARSPAEYKLPERTQEVTGKPQPVRGERRSMALNMAKARDLTVNTTVTDRAFIDHWAEGTDISVRLIRAVTAACMVEPSLNAWFDGEKMERTLHQHVNLGLAVDSPHGLSVPVIREAESKSPEELRAEINRLRKAVHNKSIKPEELQHATITLSNFGMIAGLYATPVVVPPQVAIIGTGRIADELQLRESGIVNSRYIPISLSFDHRGATGGDAVRFLAALVADLSLPY